MALLLSASADPAVTPAACCSCSTVGCWTCSAMRPMHSPAAVRVSHRLDRSSSCTCKGHDDALARSPYPLSHHERHHARYRWRTLLSRLGSCWGCKQTMLATCLPAALQMSCVEPPGAGAVSSHIMWGEVRCSPCRIRYILTLFIS